MAGTGIRVTGKEPVSRMGFGNRSYGFPDRGWRGRELGFSFRTGNKGLEPAAGSFRVVICVGKRGTLCQAEAGGAVASAAHCVPIAFPGSTQTLICRRPSPLFGPAAPSSRLLSASLHRPLYPTSLRSALGTSRQSVFR